MVLALALSIEGQPESTQYKTISGECHTCVIQGPYQPRFPEPLHEDRLASVGDRANSGDKGLRWALPAK